MPTPHPHQIKHQRALILMFNKGDLIYIPQASLIHRPLPLWGVKLVDEPLIGIFILWFLFGHRPQPKDDHPNFFGVGLVSGLTTVFIGATGPLIAPFFLKAKLTKESIISNKAICQTISHAGKIPLFIIFFQFDYFAEVELLIPLIIAVFIGTNFGKKILAFIPERVFQLLFRGSLTVIAVKLIVDQLIPILFD